MTIARVALPVGADASFDYWVPSGLSVERGALVRVRLGRRTLIGVVVDIVDFTDVPRDKLQPVTAIIGEMPALSADLLDLAHFVADYYQESLGRVLAQMLPPLGADLRIVRRTDTERASYRLTGEGLNALPAELARAPRARALYEQWRDARDALLTPEAVGRLPPHLKRTLRRWRDAGWAEEVAWTPRPFSEASARNVMLNADQQASISLIDAARDGFTPFLLEGVTGSGKTEVYLAAAEACIARGRQALLLVPEINLTPQFAQRIADTLPSRRLVTLHSRLAAGARRRHWREAADGAADLVLGTRLAVFAPMPRLGLVVVDEEHDPSFKQQEGVRYHGRDVAVWRARQRGVPIVLGSATPSLETLVHTERGHYRLLKLPRRAVAPARFPALAFFPLREGAAADGIGERLLAAIETRLQRGEQSLVFINRRGFAPSLLCSSCGWRAGCTRCAARLVVHRDAGALVCHHCGHTEALRRACPECGNVDLHPLGRGTQRLERALALRFPAARIARIDRDSTRRIGAFAAMREQVEAGELDILVGTQMLAKGHDFPRLTLVGVLGADNALYSADFRATERLAALLFQVAGRAGRAALAGEVMVETDFPSHPLYRALAAHDYRAYADVLQAERRVASLPPYAYLALLAAEAPKRDVVDAFLGVAHAVGVDLVRASRSEIEVFPPMPAMLARRAGMERGQVLAQSADRAALQRFLPGWRSAVAELPGRRVRWSLDVDPLGFA
jgi:primosomal protein N' (replication factor Y)